MDQLKIAQTKPVFTVYPDETRKKFTQYNSLSTSLKYIHSSNSFNSLSVEQASSSNTVFDYDYANNKVWTDSAIKFLLAYLSENFGNYHKNKEKFYTSATLHVGGKSSAQVRTKLQSLVKTYSEESKEKTGEGTSKWPYYFLMNEIFSNHENVHPECLINSTENANSSNKKEKFQRKKKTKLNEDNLLYIESVAAISASKKISAESRKKWNDEHVEIERERLKIKKEYKSKDMEL
ncbi:hypothetical protein C2G38_2217548 [Gigaspora rosea]|uniref:Myb/SANT-like DNA-binding domain-containing protein n=1 Tax=Gigaspora rosea TaxID=44941 RepID=A0A397UAY6_9GLOM|nr:hypothetical protein C2G38_2217548 [Gigaspora rosea]